jgi:metal-responsive CopG/Arc/MetJ family transcriptional regulator
MKTITIHVSEPVYREFQEFAKRTDRKTSELIREAMELYREQKIRRQTTHSVRDIKPVSVGKILKPWTSRAEMLEDFFDDRD